MKPFFMMATAFLLIVFFSCSSPSTNTEPEVKPKKERDRSVLPQVYGQQVALKTKAELGNNLIAAINNSGPAGAIDFCSARAYPITDSMSAEMGVVIKRVSDKPRNPSNKANYDELDFMNYVQNMIAKTGKTTSQIFEKKGLYYGHYPILIEAQCLQCHGTPGKDIAAETLKAIKAKYPADKATGYKVGDLRGLFVVEMEK